ncbi:Lsr2 family protein [Streptomyces sp. NBC_01500]|uniref:histone-like nucleoid-structuring protein Lsr2 n=1 Tax=Streptomyces sp. NBC_01500 TaxID=2903886 RepID=UPI002259A330|nr:Lsr2 family protein [Streptomyces sp. NBC_01500]MCX4554162.1 Lsr2 family protein [Streptomyces sp. NBC_01500]
MAQKVVTTFTDDLTGEASEEIDTYTVLVNGAGVEIDLTPDSHDKLLEALAPFFGAKGARRARGPVSGGSIKTKKAVSDREYSAKVRAWAKKNGYPVNERGRVAADIKEAYEKANA